MTPDPRELLPNGKMTEHDERHVSAGFDPYYFHGYRLGLTSSAETSTAAWVTWLASLTKDERFQVEIQILSAELAQQGTPFTATKWRQVVELARETWEA